MNENNKLIIVSFCLSIFLSVGWYLAENDNEILRKELSTYTGKEVRK